MTINISELLVDKLSDEELLRYVEERVLDAYYSAQECIHSSLSAELCVGELASALALTDQLLKKYIAKKYGEESATII